jgi:hypothetical protein
MNTSPKMDEDKQPQHTHASFNEVRVDEPHTFPALWDLSELLAGPPVSPNGHRPGKNGSAPPADPVERPAKPGDMPARKISELPDWDFPGSVFKPY